MTTWVPLLLVLAVLPLRAIALMTCQKVLSRENATLSLLFLVGFAAVPCVGQPSRPVPVCSVCQVIAPHCLVCSHCRPAGAVSDVR